MKYIFILTFILLFASCQSTMQKSNFNSWEELESFVRDDFNSNLKAKDSIAAYIDTVFYDDKKKKTIIGFYPKEPCDEGGVEYVVDKEKLNITDVVIVK